MSVSDKEIRAWWAKVRNCIYWANDIRGFSWDQVEMFAGDDLKQIYLDAHPPVNYSRQLPVDEMLEQGGMKDGR